MDDVTLPAGQDTGARDLPSAASGRQCALARITTARQAGTPPSPLVAAAAAALEVSPRTVWRWLRDGAPPAVLSRAWRPSPDDLDAYTRWKGNAAAAWQERRAEGVGIPGLRTFQAGVVTALTPGDRAVVRDGVAGRRRHQVYLRWAPEARNEIWECDHKRLEVLVLFPRARRPRPPWVTTFIDGYSRAVMGWAISDRPSAATVLAALGEAIRVDAERGPFGGIPGTLRPDRGLEFAADAVRHACGVLVVRLAAVRPYHAHLKGKVEKLHRSMVDGLLAQMPHFLGGPRDAAGHLWGGELPMLTLADFVGRFDEWVRHYNSERPHKALEGQTPLQRWREDATPLRLVPDEDLRWTLLTEAKPHKVRTSGVRFHRLDFVAPELNGLVGEAVEVRCRPHDDTSIEVFRGGTHLCTARPQGTLGPEEQAALLARRRADAAAQARRQRRAARSLRERFSPATAGSPATDVTVIPATVTSGRVPAGDGAQLRRLARVDLLDLIEARPS
jgi:putative transposase